MLNKQRIRQEVAGIINLTIYFGCWLGVLVLFKYLLLAEYKIEFSNFSVALFGALVLAKVVLVLEHVPLGSWVRNKPAWIDVMLRTILYAFGIFLVLLLEKTIEGRHAYGGFFASMSSLFEHADMYHVWLNTICLSGALLSYNILTVVRRNLGKGALRKMFLKPLPWDSKGEVK